jgi:hypothetical protein
LDDRAVIGSANASKNSESLQEAAVLTDFPEIVSQAKSFFFQLEETASRLTERQLQKMLKIKVIRRGGRASRTRKKRLVATGKTTWIVATVDDDNSYPEEQASIEQANRQIRKTHPEAEPDHIRWTGKDRFRKYATNGDFLVVIESTNGRRTPYGVQPPTTLLLPQHKGRWTRFYYDADGAYPMRNLKWKEFLRLIKNIRVGRPITTSSVRALTHQEAMSLITSWPRSRRRGK